MSYGVSPALQAAVFQRLISDSPLEAVVGDAIFDALPAGPAPDVYVALGPEKVRDWSDKTGGGAIHEFTVSIISQSSGFAPAKLAACAVSDALIDADLTLSRGSLVSLRFAKAAAARVGTGDTRRIDMIFRARVSDA